MNDMAVDERDEWLDVHSLDLEAQGVARRGGEGAEVVGAHAVAAHDDDAVGVAEHVARRKADEVLLRTGEASNRLIGLVIARDPLGAELLDVVGTAAEVVDPLAQPGLRRGLVAADRVPLAVEVVVAVVGTLDVRGVRPERLDDDRVDDQTRDQGPVRVGADHRLVDELLDDDDHPVGGEGGLLLAAEEAPHLHVPLFVGALRVDDGNVRVQRRHRPDRAVAVRTLHLPNQRIHRGEIALRVGAERIEREPMRAGHVAPDHAVMAVLLDLEQ